jgi:hypothetical protein
VIELTVTANTLQCNVGGSTAYREIKSEVNEMGEQGLTVDLSYLKSH